MPRMLVLMASACLVIGVLSMKSPAFAAPNEPAASQSAPSTETEIPIYTPPKKLVPRARVGGTLRGTDGKDPEIVALVPDHVALTVKQNPVVNWFLSKETTYPLRFTLVDTRILKPIFEGPIPTPKQAGVQSINLKDFGLKLEPEVQYRWYVSAIRDAESPSKDIVAGGMIERCEFSDCLIVSQADLTCDRQSVFRNVVRGFWYDAMSCLCDLIAADPTDASLRRQRAALLKQVGLDGVAEWDLKAAWAEK